MRIRSQLPGSSPLSAGALARGVAGTLVDPGAMHSRLRTLLEERFGGRAFLVGSGTQALQRALQAAATLPGLDDRTVAVPGYSCYDIVTACTGAGVRVAYYDLDPETLCPDLDSLDGLLRQGIRIVLAGNLYGFPLDWDALRSRVASVDGLLIEDAAQGVGSVWRGRGGGSFGDATILSFGRGKGWTGGGGGALLLRDRRLIPEGEPPDAGPPAWGVRALAGSLAQWVLGRPLVYGIPRSIPALRLGETVYKEPVPPGPMTSLSAALVLATAADAEAEVELRRRESRAWADALPEGPWSCPRPARGGVSAFLRFPLVTRSGSIRDRLVQELDRFGAAPAYPRALPDLEEGRRIAGLPGERNLEGVRVLAERLLTLPTHSRVAPRDRAGVVEGLRALADGASRAV